MQVLHPQPQRHPHVMQHLLQLVQRLPQGLEATMTTPPTMKAAAPLRLHLHLLHLAAEAMRDETSVDSA